MWAYILYRRNQVPVDTILPGSCFECAHRYKPSAFPSKWWCMYCSTPEDYTLYNGVRLDIDL